MKRAENSLALNSHVVQEEDWNLANAARIHFGSWKLAIEAAGLDYLAVTKYRTWSKEKIVSEIQKRAQEKRSLSWADVDREDPPLASAASKHFANWEAAVEASGYDYNSIIKLWRFKRRISHCVLAVDLKTTATKP